MSYADLYKFAQNQTIPIKRTALLAKVIEISGRQIECVITGALTTDVLRGIYLAEVDGSVALPEFYKGKDVIMLARDNNRCWRRFVLIKEAMHVFDEGLELTNTPDDFERLVDGLFAEEPEPTRQVMAESRAAWMALALFCPEGQRVEFGRLVEAGEMTTMDVAKKLKIPDQWVPHLLGKHFKGVLSRIMDVMEER